MQLICEFAAHVETLYVIEELDGFMETEIRAAGIDCIGKSVVSPMYELNPEILREAIFGVKPETRDVGVKAVARPPALCPGCRTAGSSTACPRSRTPSSPATSAAIPRCRAPLSASDTCVCMGGGFTVGVGMARAFSLSGQKHPVFGVVGDSTFFSQRHDGRG